MRLAITTENNQVSMHFGQCPEFTIVDIENNKMTNKTTVPNNTVHGGGGCVTVDEILKHNIQHVISGGMGNGAKQKFAVNKVTVSSFIGTVDQAITAFINNQTSELLDCKDHGDCH